MDLTMAGQAHNEWKVHLRKAIKNREQVDVSNISEDNCCELGKWLHGEGKIKYAKINAFNDCLTKHAIFHKEAGKVAQTINAGMFNQAEAMLSVGTPYAQASYAAVTAIGILKREVGI